MQLRTGSRKFIHNATANSQSTGKLLHLFYSRLPDSNVIFMIVAMLLTRG